MKKILKCNLTCVPLRAKASDSAEMVSQILFGEQVAFRSDGDKDWIKVSCLWDGYVGWVDKKQFVPSTVEEYKEEVYCYEKMVTINDGGAKMIGLGSIVNELHSSNDNYIKKSFEKIAQREDLLEIFDELAVLYLNAPYLWGGRSITGIDCSGLVQVWYRFLGIVLPRDASQQCLEGVVVGFLNEAQLGDLAFFENDKGKVVHVGIILDNDRIIHAAGQVRIDNLSREGIIHGETGKLTHQLRLIKRVL